MADTLQRQLSTNPPFICAHATFSIKRWILFPFPWILTGFVQASANRFRGRNDARTVLRFTLCSKVASAFSILESSWHAIRNPRLFCLRGRSWGKAVDDQKPCRKKRHLKENQNAPSRAGTTTTPYIEEEGLLGASSPAAPPAGGYLSDSSSITWSRGTS